MLTYLDAKKILAQYDKRGGACATSPTVDAFTYKCLQQMLFSGQHGAIRKFTFGAQKGCITLPYELETPLKVKIDNEVGTVFDKWFEFYNTRDLDCDEPAGKHLVEEGSYYPTVYELPQGGARIGCMGTCCEAVDAHIIVTGTDPTGRDIYSFHNGEQIHGEKITIKQGHINYTQNVFGQINTIKKSKTQGYVNLLWLNLFTNRKGFLADYSPSEEIPSYRRFRLTTPRCSPNARVGVLGRIRLRPSYMDNDLIPFDNLLAIELMGQSINQQLNNNIDQAMATNKMYETVIQKENSSKKTGSESIVEVFYPLSGGRIRGNIF